MTITVNPTHITHGRRDDPHYCPVGLAIMEATDDFPTIDGISVRFAGGRTRYLPSPVQRWIEQFDAGQVVDGMEFDLDVRSPAWL